MKFLLALLAVLILAQCASAQNVTVIGPITPGDVPQFNSTTVIKDSGISASALPIGLANPTGTVGLTTVNGVATTAMRSDAAPPLSQSISPTMTGNWAFSNTVVGNATAGGPGSAFLASGSTGAAYGWQATTAAADQKNWDSLVSTTALTFRAVNDANSSAFNWMTVTRGAGAIVSNISVPIFSINPVAATINTGLTINQSGPTSGSSSTTTSNCYGNLYLVYNLLCVNGEASNPGTTSTTAPLAIGLVMGGANSQGTKTGAQVSLLANAASNPSTARDRIALNVLAQDNAGEGGTNTGAGAKGDLFGMGIGSIARSGALNLGGVSGGEVDVGIQTGASSATRLGWSLIDNGNIQAAGNDAAYELGAAGGSPGWKTGILFSNLHGAAPLSTTGCMICTDGSAVTITTGIDFSSYTITGNVFNSQPFRVSGSGVFSRYSAAGGATPSVVSCTGLGTGSCSIVSGSLDNVGEILLSPTGAPAATGLATLTFGGAWATHGGVCNFTAHNSSAGWTAPVTFIGVAGLSTTTYQFQWANGGGTALVAGQTYLIDYLCMGF